MPQLVTQIILVDQEYYLAHGENKVEALVRYVNGLRSGYFYLEELPPNAVRSYYADYYMAQVLNGNIHQFVWNCRWDPVIVNAVSEALDALGLVHQAALFGGVRDFIERDPPRLKAFLASDYGSLTMQHPYKAELSKIGGDFRKRFTAHPNGEKAGSVQIATANAAWISSWPETRGVSAETFEQELDNLATAISDLPARKQKVEQNRPCHTSASKRSSPAPVRSSYGWAASSAAQLLPG
jgi:hypothetical protein